MVMIVRKEHALVSHPKSTNIPKKYCLNFR